MSTNYLYGKTTITVPNPDVVKQFAIKIVTATDGTSTGRYLLAASATTWADAGEARTAVDGQLATTFADVANFRTLLIGNHVGIAVTDTLDFYGDITTGTALPTNTTATIYTGISFKNKNLTLCKFNNGSTANPTANPVVPVLTNFTNCSFDGATLKCEVRYSTFDMCNMAGAILSDADLIGTDFRGSTGMALLGGGNVTNNVRTISLINGGGVDLMLPAFCGITVNTAANPDTLTITLPDTAVTVDSGLASGALTAVASPSASIPSGPIVINTSTTIITNANVGGNIGRLIPLNVLKLARAVNCVLNIQ